MSGEGIAIMRFRWQGREYTWGVPADHPAVLQALLAVWVPGSEWIGVRVED